MALLILESNNPDISYVIAKNPASGLYARTMRSGYVFGWFEEKLQQSSLRYLVYFQDGDNEVSFKGETNEFDYNNVKRYNSSIFVLGVTTDVFRSATASQQEQDLPNYTHTITINIVNIRSPKLFEVFKRDYKNIIVESEEVAPHNYKVKFTYNGTLHYLLNALQIFALFNVLAQDDEYLDISPDLIVRYLKSIEVTDPPYHIRYIFKARLINSPNKFQEVYKTVLDKSNNHTYDFQFGWLANQRANWVKSILGGEREGLPIVDFGCGEGRYIKYTKGRPYIGIENNPDRIELFKKKWGQEDGILVIPSLDDLNIEGPFNMLAVEVLEHIPVNEISALLQHFSTLPFQKLLITTPNKEFNKYFGDRDLRLEEHIHEYSMEEFIELISNNIKNANCSFGSIGDKVDGIQPTLCCCLTKRETNT